MCPRSTPLTLPLIIFDTNYQAILDENNDSNDDGIDDKMMISVMIVKISVMIQMMISVIEAVVKLEKVVTVKTVECISFDMVAMKNTESMSYHLFHHPHLPLLQSGP